MTKLLLSLIFVCCATLATALGPAFQTLAARGGNSASPLLALVGDSRRLFANQFFVMADVYFHSGYYPTIFNKTQKEQSSRLDVTEQSDAKPSKSGRHEVKDDDDSFLGPPRDWIEAFGRHFFPTVHTHLDGGDAREIMPWLKLSAEMDPNRIETYVTAAYWLRTRLNKPDDAEQFLRQGLRANPDSYEILLELGRVYNDKKNYRVARNIWELALGKWNQQDKAKLEPDPHAREEILGELVRDDQRAKDDPQLLIDLEALEKVAAGKAVLDKQIQEVKARLAHQSQASS